MKEPTEPGWYWATDKHYRLRGVVQVCTWNGGLTVQGFQGTLVGRECFIGWSKRLIDPLKGATQ